MKKAIFYLISGLIISSQVLAQEELIYKGPITAISSDSVLTIESEEGQVPKVGQKVEIHKILQFMGVNGSMKLGDGEVKSVGDNKVKVQVLKYYSTMVQDGKRVPMVKLWDVAELKWIGEDTLTKSYYKAFETVNQLYNDELYEQATIALTNLMQEYPDRTNSYLYYYRGECFYKIGKNDEALADFTKSIEINPENSQVRLFRAFTYKKLYNHEASIQDFNWLIENGELKKSDKIFILKQSAYEKQELDDLKGAEKDMKAVLELDPEDKQAYNFLNRNYGLYEYPNQSDFHMTAKVVLQFDEGYKFKLKPLNEKYKNEDCIIGFSSGEYSTDIKVGAIGKAYICDTRFTMVTCTFEVTSVSKEEFEINVLYYYNIIDNEPNVKEYNVDDKFTFDFVLKK